MPDQTLFDPNTQPGAVRATSAMAWLVAGLAFLRAGALWAGEDAVATATFFLGLGGGAAYLAMALPRRVVSAWRACRRVASAVGTINLVVLPSLVIGWAIAVGYGLWAGLDVSPAQRTQAVLAGAAATATPWAFYYALGDPRVRSWFCIADYR